MELMLKCELILLFKKIQQQKKKRSYIDISFTCVFSKLRLDWLYVEFYFRVYLSVVKKVSIRRSWSALWGCPKQQHFVVGMLIHFVLKDRVSKV